MYKTLYLTTTAYAFFSFETFIKIDYVLSHETSVYTF